MCYLVNSTTTSVLPLTRGYRITHTSVIGVSLLVLVLTPHHLLHVKSGCPKAPCLNHFFLFTLLQSLKCPWSISSAATVHRWYSTLWFFGFGNWPTTLPFLEVISICSYQNFAIWHIQTSSSSTQPPPVWLALFSCVCSHSLELIASQCSFLWFCSSISEVA